MASVRSVGSNKSRDVILEVEMHRHAPAPIFDDEQHGIRLYHGDALELLRLAKSEMFDLIFADPPYFLSNNGITCQAGKMVSVNKGIWDKAGTFEEIHKFNLEWLEQCHRLLKPDGTIWVTGTAHNIYSVGFAMQTLGYKILNDIAWYKVNPPPNLSCRYFTHSTETILWARRTPKARHTFHYEEMKRENHNKQMQSLWHIKPAGSHEKRFGKHPTQKPEALLDRIIRASSNPTELVLDPFCGSATTGVICARLDRRFIGIDLILDYLRIGIDRIESVTREHDAVLSDGCFRVEQIWLSSRASGTSRTWNEIVLTALLELGGEGDLKEINEHVQGNPRTKKNVTWPSTVRRVVRQSTCFEPIGRGRYRLRYESQDARTSVIGLQEPRPTGSRC